MKNVTEGLDRKKGTENRGNMETKMINGNKEPGKKEENQFLERRKMEWVYVGTEK